eukprot:4827011-Alexandrium_andersonii.AAC.1
MSLEVSPSSLLKLLESLELLPWYFAPPVNCATAGGANTGNGGTEGIEVAEGAIQVGVQCGDAVAEGDGGACAPPV